VVLGATADVEDAATESCSLTCVIAEDTFVAGVGKDVLGATGVDTIVGFNVTLDSAESLSTEIVERKATSSVPG
jgi:hypothetical protein